MSFGASLQLIQSYKTRAEAVEEFVRAAAGPAFSTFRLQIVAISEVAPPRGSTDPSLSCCVVSAETESGAHKLNEARAANGVPLLEVLPPSL